MPFLLQSDVIETLRLLCLYCTLVESSRMMEFVVVHMVGASCDLARILLMVLSQCIFWVGPLIGASLAAAYYQLVILAFPFRKYHSDLTPQSPL